MQQSIKLETHADKPSGLLIEVEAACRDLLGCIAVLDGLTRQPAPDLQQLSHARSRAGWARLSRRMLAEAIYAGLASRLDDRDAFSVRQNRSLVQGFSIAAAAHISRWDFHAIESDWPTYCWEAQELHIKCIRSIEAEHEMLCSLLGSHPWFNLSGSQQLRCACGIPGQGG